MRPGRETHRRQPAYAHFIPLALGEAVQHEPRRRPPRQLRRREGGVEVCPQRPGLGGEEVGPEAGQGRVLLLGGGVEDGLRAQEDCLFYIC